MVFPIIQFELQQLGFWVVRCPVNLTAVVNWKGFFQLLTANTASFNHVIFLSKLS